MTLQDWRIDADRRKRLKEILSNPDLQEALLTIERFHLPGGNVSAPKGFSSQEAICWHHAACAGAIKAITMLRTLPFQITKKNPLPEDTPATPPVEWGSFSPVSQ